MTPLRKWLVAKAEKFAERHYEGPNPPERLDQLIIEFAKLYPRATRADWVRMAVEHGRECYKAGYTRGVEYVERDKDWHPVVPPEVLADMHDPDWRWRPMDSGIEYPGPEQVVPDEPGELQRVIDEIKRTARVVWDKVKPQV